MLHPGDAVLVKASNSVGLAKLVDRVVKAHPCSTKSPSSWASRGSTT
jgi:UDP-N-acetylmuramoyl-tripeptide--D-alanyl-D-alanine ligase